MKTSRAVLVLVLLALAAASAVTQKASAPAPAPAGATAAQAPVPVELPVTRVVLSTAGVGYFEHRGQVAGDALVLLPFKADEINDALKSLVARDGAGGSPSLSYPSRESLDRALRGFRVDLSGAPNLASILARLRGASVTVEAPGQVSGRIVGIEQRQSGEGGAPQPWLLLLTATGLRAVGLHQAGAVRFEDPRIGEDFEKALALVLSSQDLERRVLELRLPGSSSREAAVGYVVPAPVWKATYRLDLTGAKPWFQAWALVDNPSEQDWRGVELSLVSGRPVSFIQDLYPPLYLERPTLPLAIAGAARARSLESGYGGELAEEDSDFLRAAESAAPPPMAAPAPSSLAKSYSAGSGLAAKPQAPASALGPGGFDAAVARAAGDQFEFTISRPVTLERRRSAMLPLVAGELEAERVTVYGPGGEPPMLGARLVNGTGLKLPAGPVAVFDGGVFAGDALLDFLPEKARRLIVFGEDLSLQASSSVSSAQSTVSVRAQKGVMILQKQTTWTRSYSLRNAGAAPKKVVVEHPITGGASLLEPAAFEEKTDRVYRFAVSVASGAEATLTVRERSPYQETVAISSLSQEALLVWISNRELSAPLREALRRAAELRQKWEEARRSLAELQARNGEITNDQGRIRQNLSAVGRDSAQGQQYLKKLLDSETELESLNAKIVLAKKTQQDAQAAFEGYVANLSVD